MITDWTDRNTLERPAPQSQNVHRQEIEARLQDGNTHTIELLIVGCILTDINLMGREPGEFDSIVSDVSHSLQILELEFVDYKSYFKI